MIIILEVFWNNLTFGCFGQEVAINTFEKLSNFEEFFNLYVKAIKRYPIWVIFSILESLWHLVSS